MRTFATVATLVALAFAAPSPRSNHVVHERRAAEPTDWIQDRRLDANRVLPMRFGLAQQNMHRLEQILMDISHPESSSYGQHWSPAKVVETFAPSSDTITAVTSWLKDAGIAADRLRLSPNKGWIQVNATTSEVESLLNTEYHVYTHPSGAEQIGSFSLIFFLSDADYVLHAGCHSYSVPAHIREHIDLIKPTVHFNHRPSPQTRTSLERRAGNLGAPTSGRGPKKSTAKVTITPTLENCDQMITLDCLRALYSVDYKPVATAKNSYGIGRSSHPVLLNDKTQNVAVEFTPQAFLEGDLDLFFR